MFLKNRLAVLSFGAILSGSLLFSCADIIPTQPNQIAKNEQVSVKSGKVNTSATELFQSKLSDSEKDKTQSNQTSIQILSPSNGETVSSPFIVSFRLIISPNVLQYGEPVTVYRTVINNNTGQFFDDRVVGIYTANGTYSVSSPAGIKGNYTLTLSTDFGGSSSVTYSVF